LCIIKDTVIHTRLILAMSYLSTEFEDSTFSLPKILMKIQNIKMGDLGSSRSLAMSLFNRVFTFHRNCMSIVYHCLAI